ncbi:hypothetical protein SIID45300_01775 [Candidatus Magnetaquicoccaceae bacterium FCR-1]|uniref:Uncharacterized protein n=1 Tax=Candidatus Magnetaquiglobus chichijimensis TaxID=3141448 RepID=A0ABQ0C990_9PROT
MENETGEIEEMAIEGEVIPPPADVATTGSARGVDYFANWVSQSWRDSMEGIFETGRRLSEARKALGNEFETLLNRLPFGRVTALRLRRVAESPRFANCSPVNNLPSSYSILHELLTLPQEVFDDLLDKGLINKDTTRQEIVDIKTALKTGQHTHSAKTTGGTTTSSGKDGGESGGLPTQRTIDYPKRVKLILTVPEATMLQEMFESASKIGMVTQWINKNFTAKDKERPDPDKLAKKFADLNLPEIFFATR